jgi:hypothetical protein
LRRLTGFSSTEMGFMVLSGIVAERKLRARSAKRALQTVTILIQERRELEEITRHLERAQEYASSPQCALCERLAHEVIAAMRNTRVALAEQSRAECAGVIDDIDFLDGDGQIEAAFSARQRARVAYLEHRREAHK